MAEQSTIQLRLISTPVKKLSSKTLAGTPSAHAGYDAILFSLVALLQSARQLSARAVNTIMTATYWEIGRRIVEHEQYGKKRAGYGEALLERLSADLTARFGCGFSRQNLHKYRQFFLSYSAENIRPTPSGKLLSEKRLRRCADVSGERLSRAHERVARA